MTFTQSIRSVFSKYASFSGRASRSEYWYFALFNFIVSAIVCALACTQIPFHSLVVSEPTEFYVSLAQSVPVWLSTLWTIYYLAMLLPSLAVTVRRLHDTGRGGGWIFISLVPFIGYIWFFILMILPGEPRENRFGPLAA